MIISSFTSAIFSYNYSLIPGILSTFFISLVPSCVIIKILSTVSCGRLVKITKSEEAEFEQILNNLTIKYPRIYRTCLYAELAYKIARNSFFKSFDSVSKIIRKNRKQAYISKNKKYMIIPFTFKNNEFEIFVPIKHEIISEHDELYDEDENKIFGNHLPILPRLIGINEYEKKMYKKTLNEDTWDYEIREVKN
jgi:hypothetical protein